MHRQAYIHFSYKHREYVVVPRRFTLDGIMFDDDTAYASVIDCEPKVLGHQIKDALSQCKQVSRTIHEMHAIWSNRQYVPLAVSAAKTLDEYYEDYYPICAYHRDKKLWIAAAHSQKVDIPAQALEKNCKDSVLGTETMKLMERVQQLLSQ